MDYIDTSSELKVSVVKKCTFFDQKLSDHIWFDKTCVFLWHFFNVIKFLKSQKGNEIWTFLKMSKNRIVN